MNKIFNVEIDGQITLPDGRKLGPFEETTVNVVQPSEGGSDPIVENAKQTGGFGWTESGEETTITWDGDTEGREIVSSVPPFQLVKVAEAENHEKFQSANVSLNIMGSIIDGIVSNVEETEIESIYRALVPIEGDDVAAVFIAENSWEFGGENHSAGIYFIYDDGNIFVTSLIYGGDTVHKIDEKYLPSGGGVMVVTVESDGDGVLHANKTFAEIKSAIKSGLDVNCVISQKNIARLSAYFFDE